MALVEEDFVISGFSARFPQADSFAEFKEKLYKGVDFVTDDATRWPRGYLGMPERMGKIHDLSRLDAEFFGVLPRQAHVMDPQMRLLLETTYEAIVDAGYDPETLRGRKVGVFIGCCNCESHEAFSFNPEKIDGYSLVGSSPAMFANRIAHSFDFHGPSMAIDTACSSTMTAFGQAMLALRSGQCEAAVVGGSSVFLKATTSLSFHRLGILSPSGACKTFDSSGDGYARSETVGAFFVQSAAEARRNYAKVTNIKVYSDGYRKEGITFPSNEGQKRLFKDTYAEVGLDPRKVGYVEAHGTGTPAGDTQEIISISSVFCQTRRETPLKVGAVKSNAGHAEPASAISSIGKVILAMETGVIAGNLHFKEPLPHIASLHDSSIEIVGKNTPFQGGPVGINSFGLGGTSAHLILETVPGPHVDDITRDKPYLPRLVVVAGRSKESLEHSLDRLEGEGPYPDSAYALLNRAVQQNLKLFPYRGYALIPLEASGREVVKVVERAPFQKRPLWFVFTGMGCQWKGMAQQMMQLEPFKYSIQKSQELLKQLDVDLVYLLSNEDGADQSMAQVQASIVAVQVALVDTLEAVGIQPDGMVGHSLGEISCAYADGSLTAEEAVLCAYWRGRCTDLGSLPNGAMAAVGLTWEEAAKRCPDGVVPACHNAYDSVTVSGPAKTVDEFVGELQSEGVFVREVDSMNVAFHSEHMQFMAPAFRDALKKVLPTSRPRTKRWISSTLPESHWKEPIGQHCSVDYFIENLVRPVLFYEALLHVPKDAILLEIAPNCILQAILRRVLGPDASYQGLMKRDEDNIAYFFNSLGRLHNLGIQIDVSHLYPPVPFPVPRGTPSIGHLVSWDHSEQWTVAKWNDFATSHKFYEELVEIDLDSNLDDAYLTGHRLDGRVLFPAAGYMVLAWKCLTKLGLKPFNEVPVVFEDVAFHRATILPKTGTVRFRVHVMPASGEFEVSENGCLAASGRIRISGDAEKVLSKDPTGSRAETMAYELDAEDIYKDLRLRGYGHTGAFQNVLKADLQSSCGKLKWDNNWVTFIDGMLQFCAFLDPLKAFRLPARILSCLIDPEAQSAVADKVGQEGIPVLYDDCLNTCSAGGVAIRGLKAFIAPRRGARQTACIEEYTFVPYIDDEAAISERAACLQEYVSMCSSALKSILEMSSETIPEVSELVKNFCRIPEEVHQRCPTNTGDSNGLLRILRAIQEKLNSCTSDIRSAVEWALTAQSKYIEEDNLYKALLEEDPLRALLDVVLENTNGRKIRILELAFEKSHLLLTKYVSKLLPLSNLLLKTEYAVAHPRPDDLTSEQLEDAVTRFPWDPSSDSTDGLPDAQLIIACVVPTISNHLETLAKQLSSICKENAFALVCMRTAWTPAEVFLQKVRGISSSIHGKDSALSLLCANGFRLVALKSNNWSTLLLLRKKTIFGDAPREEVLEVKNFEFDWVEPMKMKVIHGENLWLIGKDAGVSGVVGLLNCLRVETGTSRIKCIFDANLQDSRRFTDVSLSDSEYKDLLDGDLAMNVRRDGKWGTFRHLTFNSRGAPKKTTEYAFLSVHTRGDLSSLQWYESPLGYMSPSCSSEKVICSVYYAPLNFRDVMVATGKLLPDVLPDDAATSERLLGLEFSGRDPQGRRVIGTVRAEGLATAVSADPEWLWVVPDEWSLEEASTIPIVYCTAYYALLVRGNLQPGESLLIHSGSGGVGQAAISIALSMGCTVFTTVGSEEKRLFLRRRFEQLRDRNIGSSRDLSFEELVLRETKGKGVDLVLNSLSEDKLQASVRCLAKHGRFLEIGKVDLSKNTSLGMSVFLKNISFHGINLDELIDNNLLTQKDKRRVGEILREGIVSGAVRPLAVNRFRWDQAEEAFRFMASGQHIGKVVLELRPEESSLMTCPASPLTVEAVPRTYFYEHKSYVVAGGLGGVGLELVDWMIARGCRKLLLSSRSGVKNGYQKLCLRRWQHSGAQVLVTRANISTLEGARQVIEEALAMGPVGGVFNLAMVLSDAVVENQTAESFRRVCEPKVNGTHHLDQLSRELCPELDHFVAFSSIACGRGNIGQVNYGYANSVIERICEQRVANGLPGLAIQWGPIADVGVVYKALGDNVDFGRCAPQKIGLCMDVLDQFLSQDKPVMSCFVKADLSTKYEEIGQRGLMDTIAHIFGIKDPASLNPNMTLSDLGMDSLMAVEVQQTLERDYDISMSVSDTRQLTVAQIRELGNPDGNTPPATASEKGKED